MKKHLLTLLFFSILGFISAQDEDCYATIKFYGGNIDNNPNIKIFAGNQPAFTLHGNEVIIFKMFSKKGMKFEYHNNGVFSFHNKFYRMVEKGMTYHYLADFTYSTKLFTETDEATIQKKFKKTILKETIIYEDTNLVSSKETKPYANGTGFLISSEGYIVTNSHVVDKAAKINVKGIGGDFATKYSAKVIVNDKSNDIAILKLDVGTFILDSVPYAIRPAGVETGEDIFVLGYPLKTVMGEEIKLTTGVVSSKSGFEGNFSTYQVSAMVQPGNSGSPLFDRNGNLIGIINAKLTGTEAVNYAIKITYLGSLLETSGTKSELYKTPLTTTAPLVDLVKRYSSYIYIIETEK